MLLDTGAQGSMIQSGTGDQLHLDHDPHNHTTLYGTGGTHLQADNVLVHGLRFGDRETGELSLPVGKLPGPIADNDPPIAGLLGLNVLSPYDIDIDRPANRVALYLRAGCATDAPVWTGPATPIPLIKAYNNLLLIPVFLDGVRLEAIIDTGALRSVISDTVIPRLRLDPAALAADPVTSGEGIDHRHVSGHLHRFASFRIGQTTFHDARLDIGSAHLVMGDMLLGEDFFRRHRVWLSPSTDTAFIAPAAP